MNLRPGQGTQSFQRFAKGYGETSGGRPREGDLSPAGTIEGILTAADPAEAEIWRQRSHPVSHEIVQYGTKNAAAGGDVLVLGTGKTARWFYVQGIENPGNLDHFIIYYCEERRGLHECGA